MLESPLDETAKSTEKTLRITVGAFQGMEIPQIQYVKIGLGTVEFRGPSLW